MYLDILVIRFILLCWQEVEFNIWQNWCLKLHPPPPFKVTVICFNNILFICPGHNNVITIIIIMINELFTQRRTDTPDNN